MLYDSNIGLIHLSVYKISTWIRLSRTTRMIFATPGNCSEIIVLISKNEKSSRFIHIGCNNNDLYEKIMSVHLSVIRNGMINLHYKIYVWVLRVINDTSSQQFSYFLLNFTRPPWCFILKIFGVLKFEALLYVALKDDPIQPIGYVHLFLYLHVEYY